MIPKFIILLLIVLGTVGCTKKYKIEPDELPIAHVDQAYNQELIILGGRVVDDTLKITNDFPNNMNIAISSIDDDSIPEMYNNLKIEGTPRYKGRYSINISAQFYGGGDNKLDKTYYLVVN